MSSAAVRTVRGVWGRWALLAMIAACIALAVSGNARAADLLVFESDRNEDLNAAYDVFTMAADGSSVTQLTDGGGNEPAWNADGTKIAFSTNGNYGEPRACLRNLFAMDHDGTGKAWILGGEGCSSQATDSCSFNNFPSWSPDGTKIVYAGDDCFASGVRVPGGIFVVELATRTRTRLTTNQVGLALDADPAWSHDGTRIAFARADPSGYHIYVMDADGGNLTQLESLGGAYPAWSPDDSRIAFGSSRDGNWEIWVMEADGSNPVQLTNTGIGTNGNPDWSPDGSRIAFDSVRPETGQVICCDYEIWVMNADGSSQTQITHNDYPYNDARPSWQPVSGDVLVSDCDDPALAQLTTVPGDLVIDTIPGCNAVDLPNLTQVDGNLTIVGNASATVVNLAALGSVTGSLEIVDNDAVGSLDLGSLTSAGGVNVSGNASAGSLDLSSLASTSGSLVLTDNSADTVVDLASPTQVGGDLELESATGTLDVSGADVTGDVTLTGMAADTVSATTGGGSTEVAVLGGTASMHVVLPEGTFDQPVAFTVERQADGPAEAGLAADGSPAQIDPLGGYRFTFAVPVLNQEAQLAFTIELAELDDATRAALLAGVEDGGATLAVRGDEAGAAYQAFARCAPGQTPAADGCVEVVLLDANGDPAAPGAEPAFVRFEGVAGHFSTWAVALVKASGALDTAPPALSVPADVTVDATGPAGATVTYSASASDAVDPSPQLVCEPASGGVFPIGTTTVTCTATDAAGNSASASFGVHVRNAAEQIALLRSKTLAYLDLPRLGSKLVAPLDRAATALAGGNVRAACLNLKDYSARIRAVPRGAFTPAERTELLADAARIRAVIGCHRNAVARPRSPRFGMGRACKRAPGRCGPSSPPREKSIFPGRPGSGRHRTGIDPGCNRCVFANAAATPAPEAARSCESGRSAGSAAFQLRPRRLVP